MAETKVELTRDEQFLADANRHGKSCVEDMRDDLAALKHAQTCTRKNCKRGNETKKFKRADGTVGEQMKHQNPEAWHDEDRARGAIEEGHYGVQVRTGWYTPGSGDATPEEYMVVLGGGGPAMRIIGDLDNGTPTSAHYEFQDWFKPWTRVDLTHEEEQVILEWVGHLTFEY